MAYFRLQTGLQTGFKNESNPGTPETLTSANFVTDVNASLIIPKYSTAKIDVGGRVGNDKVVTTKVYGELATFKVPFSNGAGLELIKCIANVSGNNYQIAGSYSNQVSPNKGRIGTSAITVNQYDGQEMLILAGSKPSSLKVGAKAGEPIYLEGALQGSFSKAISGIQYFQSPSTSFVINNALGNTISIGGQSWDFTDIEIDFKPTLAQIESGAVSTGYAQFEITDLQPAISVTLYPGDPTVKDLWAMLATNTPVPFSWTFGTGVGNTFTITAQVQIDTQDAPYDSGKQTRKLSLIPVFNPATAYNLNINVA